MQLWRALLVSRLGRALWALEDVKGEGKGFFVQDAEAEDAADANLSRRAHLQVPYVEGWQR